MSLNPGNINMSQLAMGHPNAGLRISPQSIPPPSHMQQCVPTSSAASALSMIPCSSASTMSPSTSIHSPAMRSPSPSDKKKIDVDSPAEDRVKEGSALNMTITPTVAASSSSPSSNSGDIRTNSITALRIRAKEHLENINKNLAMV
jgi:hypothetical protein